MRTSFIFHYSSLVTAQRELLIAMADGNSAKLNEGRDTLIAALEAILAELSRSLAFMSGRSDGTCVDHGTPGSETDSSQNAAPIALLRELIDELRNDNVTLQVFDKLSFISVELGRIVSEAA